MRRPRPSSSEAAARRTGSPRPNLALMALLFTLGVGSLYRFSQNLLHASHAVRLVDVVGLSGGGAACGAALFGIIFAVIAKNKA